MASNLSRPAPTPADYRVPSNLVEHNLMVQRLMSGGSIQSEAEQMMYSSDKVLVKPYSIDNTSKSAISGVYNQYILTSSCLLSVKYMLCISTSSWMLLIIQFISNHDTLMAFISNSILMNRS